MKRGRSALARNVSSIRLLASSGLMAPVRANASVVHNACGLSIGRSLSSMKPYRLFAFLYLYRSQVQPENSAGHHASIGRVPEQHLDDLEAIAWRPRCCRTRASPPAPQISCHRLAKKKAETKGMEGGARVQVSCEGEKDESGKWDENRYIVRSLHTTK